MGPALELALLLVALAILVGTLWGFAAWARKTRDGDVELERDRRLFAEAEANKLEDLLEEAKALLDAARTGGAAAAAARAELEAAAAGAAPGGQLAAVERVLLERAAARRAAREAAAAAAAAAGAAGRPGAADPPGGDGAHA